MFYDLRLYIVPFFMPFMFYQEALIWHGLTPIALCNPWCWHKVNKEALQRQEARFHWGWNCDCKEPAPSADQRLQAFQTGNFQSLFVHLATCWWSDSNSSIAALFQMVPGRNRKWALHLNTQHGNKMMSYWERNCLFTLFVYLSACRWQAVILCAVVENHSCRWFFWIFAAFRLLAVSLLFCWLWRRFFLSSSLDFCWLLELTSMFRGWGPEALTKRYHALTRLPHKAHWRISPNGIADMCTRENSQTIGITMDIFPSPSMLETRHFIFPCEGRHLVFWGWPSSRQSCILDNVRWNFHTNFHTWSILHVFQGTQGMLWGGLGGGAGDVITSVGTFTHGWYTTCFPRHARTRTHVLVATPQGCLSAVAHVLSITYYVSGLGTIIKSYNSGDQKVYMSFKYHLNSIQLSSKFTWGRFMWIYHVFRPSLRWCLISIGSCIPFACCFFKLCVFPRSVFCHVYFKVEKLKMKKYEKIMIFDTDGPANHFSDNGKLHIFATWKSCKNKSILSNIVPFIQITASSNCATPAF